MKIVNAGFIIMTPINGVQILKDIEHAGRVCYKNEDKIIEDSVKRFVQRVIKSGHESVIEHISISVRIICDRGVSHEIVRHRLASYSQESTRYCNYSKGKFGGEITIKVEPVFWDNWESAYIWLVAMQQAEQNYMQLISMGWSPQEARSVLPNSLKTELVMTANLREWGHFFKLRCDKAAHPQMREIVCPILQTCKKLIPVVFDDIDGENNNEPNRKN